MKQSKLLFYCLGVIFLYVIVVVMKGNISTKSVSKENNKYNMTNEEFKQGLNRITKNMQTKNMTNAEKAGEIGNVVSNITKTYTM